MSRALSFRQVKESPKATSKQGVQKNKKTLFLFSQSPSLPVLPRSKEHIIIVKKTNKKGYWEQVSFLLYFPIWGKGVVPFFMIF